MYITICVPASCSSAMDKVMETLQSHNLGNPVNAACFRRLDHAHENLRTYKLLRDFSFPLMMAYDTLMKERHLEMVDLIAGLTFAKFRDVIMMNVTLRRKLAELFSRDPALWGRAWNLTFDHDENTHIGNASLIRMLSLIAVNECQRLDNCPPVATKVPTHLSLWLQKAAPYCVLARPSWSSWLTVQPIMKAPLFAQINNIPPLSVSILYSKSTLKKLVGKMDVIYGRSVFDDDAFRTAYSLCDAEVAVEPESENSLILPCSLYEMLRFNRDLDPLQPNRLSWYSLVLANTPLVRRTLCPDDVGKVGTLPSVECE